jgi:hypothetical protein
MPADHEPLGDAAAAGRVDVLTAQPIRTFGSFISWQGRF